MKIILKFIVVSLAVLSSNSYAQSEKYCIENLNALIKSNNWIKNAVKPSKDEQEKIFKALFKDETFSFANVIDESKVPDTVSVEGVWDSAFIAQHYFIDIDGDKDLDVLFDGAHYKGSTEGNVDVYLNKKNEYIKKVHSNGKITFAGGKLDSVYTVVIYHFPIGNKIEHNIETYECGKDKFNLANTITFFNNPPAVLAEAGTVDVPENGSVHISPGNSKLSPEADEIGKVQLISQLSQIKRALPLKYYATQTDKSGNQWYYVKVRDKDLISLKNPSWKNIMGWVKK